MKLDTILYYIYNIIIVELQFQRYNLFRILRCESNSARLKLYYFFHDNESREIERSPFPFP